MTKNNSYHFRLIVLRAHGIEVLKNSVATNTNVGGLSATYQLPTNITHQTALSLGNEKDADRKLMTAISVDADFPNTIGLQIIAGKTFTPNIEKNI